MAQTKQYFLHKASGMLAFLFFIVNLQRVITPSFALLQSTIDFDTDIAIQGYLDNFDSLVRDLSHRIIVELTVLEPTAHSNSLVWTGVSEVDDTGDFFTSFEAQKLPLLLHVKVTPYTRQDKLPTHSIALGSTNFPLHTNVSNEGDVEASKSHDALRSSSASSSSAIYPHPLLCPLTQFKWITDPIVILPLTLLTHPCPPPLSPLHLFPAPPPSPSPLTTTARGVLAIAQAHITDIMALMYHITSNVSLTSLPPTSTHIVVPEPVMWVRLLFPHPLPIDTHALSSVSPPSTSSSPSSASHLATSPSTTPHILSSSILQLCLHILSLISLLFTIITVIIININISLRVLHMVGICTSLHSILPTHTETQPADTHTSCIDTRTQTEAALTIGLSASANDYALVAVDGVVCSMSADGHVVRNDIIVDTTDNTTTNIITTVDDNTLTPTNTNIDNPATTVTATSIDTLSSNSDVTSAVAVTHGNTVPHIVPHTSVAVEKMRSSEPFTPTVTHTVVVPAVALGNAGNEQEMRGKMTEESYGKMRVGEEEEERGGGEGQVGKQEERKRKQREAEDVEEQRERGKKGQKISNTAASTASLQSSSHVTPPAIHTPVAAPIPLPLATPAPVPMPVVSPVPVPVPDSFPLHPSTSSLSTKHASATTTAPPQLTSPAISDMPPPNPIRTIASSSTQPKQPHTSRHGHHQPQLQLHQQKHQQPHQQQQSQQQQQSNYRKKPPSDTYSDPHRGIPRHESDDDGIADENSVRNISSRENIPENVSLTSSSVPNFGNLPGNTVNILPKTLSTTSSPRKRKTMSSDSLSSSSPPSTLSTSLSPSVASSASPGSVTHTTNADTTTTMTTPATGTATATGPRTSSTTADIHSSGISLSEKQSSGISVTLEQYTGTVTHQEDNNTKTTNPHTHTHTNTNILKSNGSVNKRAKYGAQNSAAFRRNANSRKGDLPEEFREAWKSKSRVVWLDSDGNIREGVE